MGVGRYILARLALTVPMLLILLTIVFLILRVIPGDPCLAMLGGRNVPLSQVRPALVLAEVSEGHHAQQGLPAGIGPPGRRRGAATGQHHKRLRRELRQECFPQPAVQGRQGLVGVDEKDVASGRGGERLKGQIGGG